jgi:integrase
LGLRQKDVIGEWIPLKWPGLSDVIRGGKKWVIGLRWEEIDADLILKHRLSKSIHGAKTLMDPAAGTLKAWDLRMYPLIMEELARLCGGPVERSKLPAKGPVIINESSGAPWNVKHFQREWRKIAKAAGIPSNIQNRDSRPGAATEADLAGADKDKTRRMLGHAKGETTEIYLREELEVQRELANLRVQKRKP